MPKISVLMPVYKTKEEYLRAAIESILNQTYQDFEFLILDDCPDNTREDIVKSYKDTRIKYAKNERNLGITGSRNKLISMAKGEYLAVMDHDDISAPTRFAKEVEVLDENPEIGVVGSNIHKIVANKDVIQPEFDEDIKIGLMMKCVINHPSSMIRKSVLIKNNIAYEEHYSPAEDYKLWCRLIGVTKFYNIQEVLLNYRDWNGSTTNRSSNKMENATLEIWSQNEINYPVWWKTFDRVKAKKVQTIRLLNCIPFLKIVEKGRRKQVLLFEFIPVLSIKNSIKVLESKERYRRFIKDKSFQNIDKKEILNKEKSASPKISVIIPVYNVEQYLPRCLDSVLAQTFTDFEVICVNDGSPDNSAAILTEYAQRDNRIRIINQENQGLSGARNTGLKTAQGEYIYFLDSDDCLHPQALEVLYRFITENKADIVSCDFSKNDTSIPSFQKIEISDIPFEITDNPLHFNKKGYTLHISACTKLYKRSILNDLEFIRGIHFEDCPWTLAIWAKHPRTVVLQEKLYYYTIDENSISHCKAKPQQIKDYHTGLNFVYHTYCSPEFREDFQCVCRTYVPIILKQQLGRCKRSDKKVRPEMFKAFAEELRDLKSKDMLSWRGHKITRYLKYLWIMKKN